MTKTICSDCESEIVDSFGIIEGPNGEVCSDCFEKNFKKKLKNTLLKLVIKKKANMSNISENSKPMNYFKVVRERQNRELSNALLKSCEYITVECSRCPLNEKEDCAGNKMPPKPFEEDRHSICTDWIGIYFRNLVQNKKAK